MKLRRGKPSYKIPEHSQVFRVRIEGNQRHNQMHSHLLCMVSISDIPNPNKSDRPYGFPTMCAVFEGTIEFYPIPDKPYVAKVQYAPPIREY